MADEAIASLADLQYGVVARRQLLERGASRHEIAHRIERRHLIPVHRAVYAVGRRRLTLHGEWMAGVLAAGPRAALSHACASALFRFAGPRRGVAVTVPHGARLRIAGVTVHRARSLLAEDLTERDRIPVTSVPRTLLDLAGCLDRDQLANVLEAADRERELELAALEALLERSPRHRGVPALRELLSSYRVDLDDHHQELERRFRKLCLEFELQMPASNVFVEGFLVDAFWPQHRLVVELDSFRFHKDRAAFERDRARDVALGVAGYTVLRFTWRQVTERPAQVADAVRRLTRPREPHHHPAAR